jgi:hypothetical protein
MTAAEFRKLMSADKNEGDFKAEVIEYLRAIGVWVWNNPRGLYKAPDGGTISFGGPDGASDLFGILPDGRFLAVETKNPNGTYKATPDQVAFVEKVNQMGGIGIVAKNLDEVIAVVKPATIRRQTWAQV